jgi:hypothetical protein
MKYQQLSRNASVTAICMPELNLTLIREVTIQNSLTFFVFPPSYLNMQAIITTF